MSTNDQTISRPRRPRGGERSTSPTSAQRSPVAAQAAGVCRGCCTGGPSRERRAPERIVSRSGTHFGGSGLPALLSKPRKDDDMTDAEQPDPAALATAIDRLLATVPEGESSTADRMLRARLEGYAFGLRDGRPRIRLEDCVNELRDSSVRGD